MDGVSMVYNLKVILPHDFMQSMQFSKNSMHSMHFMHFIRTIPSTPTQFLQFSADSSLIDMEHHRYLSL